MKNGTKDKIKKVLKKTERGDNMTATTIAFERGIIECPRRTIKALLNSGVVIRICGVGSDKHHAKFYKKSHSIVEEISNNAMTDTFSYDVGIKEVVREIKEKISRGGNLEIYKWSD